MALRWQQQTFKSDFKLTTDTPYLALTGELWDVCCDVLEKIYCVIMAPHCVANMEMPKVAETVLSRAFIL